MFQTPSCFIMNTWIAGKVKAVKQNKQLSLSSSNIVMLAWKWLVLTMPFLLFETWIGSEEQKHNEGNSVHLLHGHKSILRANTAFYIHQYKGLIGIPYYTAYLHPAAATWTVSPRNQLKMFMFWVCTSESFAHTHIYIITLPPGYLFCQHIVSNNNPIKQLIWAFLAEVDPKQAAKKSSHFQQPYTTRTILFGY